MHKNYCRNWMNCSNWKQRTVPVLPEVSMAMLLMILQTNDWLQNAKCTSKYTKSMDDANCNEMFVRYDNTMVSEIQVADLTPVKRNNPISGTTIPVIKQQNSSSSLSSSVPWHCFHIVNTNLSHCLCPAAKDATVTQALFITATNDCIQPSFDKVFSSSLSVNSPIRSLTIHLWDVLQHFLLLEKFGIRQMVEKLCSCEPV